MNTKMLSQLEVMDAEMLAKVEGGYSSTDCRNALIAGVTTGIITARVKLRLKTNRQTNKQTNKQTAKTRQMVCN